MTFLIRALCVVMALPAIAAAQTSQHSRAYKPFSITSSKLKKEISVDQFERTFMCKTAVQIFGEMTDLMQNYDFLGTQVSPDGTASSARFLGKQGGKTVPVDLIVNRSNQRLSWVDVDGQPTLDCRD